MELALIGGGATGAMIAWHLLRRRPDLAGKVTIFEPRAVLGAGLAYGAADPAHRLNVPAHVMTLDSATPEDFRDRLLADGLERRDPAAFQSREMIYPARAEFGRYLAAKLAPLLQSRALTHVRAKVTSVMRDGASWRITAGDGAAYTARRVVIATSHPPPSLPAPLRVLEGDPRLIADPWADGAPERIGPGDRVAIVGMGLTMADIVASLEARGHDGPILAFSRRGLRSRGHTFTPWNPAGDFSTAPETTALGLLRRIRRTLGDFRDRPWQDVLDGMRMQAGAVWRALPAAEQRRAVRHLRVFWDAHRFRIAPQIEALLDRRIAAGTLTLRAARLLSASAEENAITLTLSGHGTERRIEADIVVNATGPDHAGMLRAPGFLRDLAREGLIEPDDAGLGLRADTSFRAIAKGAAVPGLYVAGPLARGAFGELMGLPEITQAAEAAAAMLATRIT